MDFDANVEDTTWHVDWSTTEDYLVSVICET